MTTIDYSKAVIYKLCCNDLSVPEIYIGSTLAFRERKRSHKNSCNNPNDTNYNYKVYKYIRENGGFENWDMIVVEEYTACQTKQQLHTRERWYIETLKSNLNSQVPARTDKEIKESNKHYKEQNKEHISVANKQYRDDNKEYILQRSQQPVTCECGCIVRYSNLCYHKSSLKHTQLMSS